MYIVSSYRCVPNADKLCAPLLYLIYILGQVLAIAHAAEGDSKVTV